MIKNGCFRDWWCQPWTFNKELKVWSRERSL
jgi:hypothetical protein